MDKRPLLVTSALAVVLALAGCGAGGSGATPSPTRTPSATATSPAPTSSATPTPLTPTSPTPSPDPAAAWTGETAYAACIDFHRQKTTADGFDPDASTWNPYSPESARQSGGQWTVDLIGTVEGEDGATYDGVFSCVVAGTPASPSVSESIGG